VEEEAEVEEEEEGRSTGRGRESREGGTCKYTVPTKMAIKTVSTN
jgi:hypothetical protein